MDLLLLLIYLLLYWNKVQRLLQKFTIVTWFAWDQPLYDLFIINLGVIGVQNPEKHTHAILPFNLMFAQVLVITGRYTQGDVWLQIQREGLGMSIHTQIMILVNPHHILVPITAKSNGFLITNIL